MSTPAPAPGGAVDRRTPGRPPSGDLQRLWFVLARRPWSSLALLPAHPGGSALGAARALVEVGGLHGARPLKLFDAEGLVADTTALLLRELSQHLSSGGQAVVALDSPLVNPAGFPVIFAVDAALLCVTLGHTDMASAHQTIELMGRERLLGSVMVPPRGAR